jgi:sugar lactone lactonase YvrE
VRGLHGLRRQHDGRLFLLSHGRIHELGFDGMRRASMDLGALDAPTRPSDFDRHADGRIVLTDPDAPQLVRCAWPAGPCEKIPVDLANHPIQEVLPLGAAKLHVDDSGGRYFISDNSGHRVLVTDHAGKLLSNTRPRLVNHPNALALAAPDKLAIVDTDNRRILTLAVNGGRIGDKVAEIPTATKGLVRPGRTWPFDVARFPDGTTAVLIAAMAMRDADLVFFDAAGKPARRAALPDDIDPFDVEVWRGHAWVADAVTYRFVGVTAEGHLGPPLEDSAFLAELQDERRAADLWRQSRAIAQVGLVLIPLFGALMLKQLGEVKPAPKPATPEKAPAGVTWIEPRAEFRQRVRRTFVGLGWFLLVVFVAWCAAFMLLFRHYVFSVGGIRLLLPSLGLTALMAVACFVLYRQIPRRFTDWRLSPSRDALQYSFRQGGFMAMKLRTGTVPWGEVHHDNRRLLAGKHILPLRHHVLGEIFGTEALKPVLDRVPRDHGHSWLGLTRLAIVKGAIPWWHVALYILAFAIVLARLVDRLL